MYIQRCIYKDVYAYTYTPTHPHPHPHSHSHPHPRTHLTPQASPWSSQVDHKSPHFAPAACQPRGGVGWRWGESQKSVPWYICYIKPLC